MVQTKCGFDSAPGVSGSDLLVQHGPTLIVDIGFDPDFEPVAYAKANKIPISGIQGTHALVDTGATESCIDSLLAATLNLPVFDRREIAGVGGRHEVNMYLAQVHVRSLGYTIYGAFAGVDLKAGGQVHDALLGRTFLSRFTMNYEGLTGTVTISRE